MIPRTFIPIERYKSFEVYQSSVTGLFYAYNVELPDRSSRSVARMCNRSLSVIRIAISDYCLADSRKPSDRRIRGPLLSQDSCETVVSQVK